MPTFENDTYDGGTLVRRETVDTDAEPGGTYTLEEGDPLAVVEGPRPLTDAERLRYDPPPTDEEQIRDAVLPPAEGTPERDTYDTLRQQAQGSLDVLRTSIDALKVIYGKTNAEIGPKDTKDVARESRRIARQTLALSRLLLRALDNADTGED